MCDYAQAMPLGSSLAASLEAMAHMHQAPYMHGSRMPGQIRPAWLAVIQDSSEMAPACAGNRAAGQLASALSAGDGAHCPSAYEWSRD